MQTDLLFVYGTLKQGGRNHRLLAAAEYVGPACTEPKFRLIDCGAYPALIEHEHAPLAIMGELYRIPESLWPALDELEDEGTLYRRITLPVTLLTGIAGADAAAEAAPISVFTYLWLGRTDRFPLVAGAEWPVK